MLFPDGTDLKRFRHGARWNLGPAEGGDWQHRIYSMPVHRRKLAEWIEMDNAVLDDTRFRVDGRELAFSIDRLLLRSADGSRERELGTPDLTVDGHTASSVFYEDIWPSVDLRWAINPSGLKEELTIRRLPSVPVVYQDGVLIMSGTLTGRGGLKVGRPTLVDAAGERGPCHVAWVAPGEWELRASIAWLIDEERPFPVVLDPTIYCEGNDLTLYLQGLPYADQRWQNIDTKFDVSSLAGQTLLTGNLYHYLSQHSKQSFNITSHRLTDGVYQTWTEATSVADMNAITLSAALDTEAEDDLKINEYNGWLVKAGIQADIDASNTYFSSCLFYDASVTNNAMTTGDPNYLGNGIQDGVGQAFFDSDEGTNRPYLDVTYSAAGGVDRVPMEQRMRYGKGWAGGNLISQRWA